jgi:hypothetical protein
MTKIDFANGEGRRLTQDSFHKKGHKRTISLFSLIKKNTSIKFAKELENKEKRKLNENEELIMAINKSKADYKNLKHRLGTNS